MFSALYRPYLGCPVRAELKMNINNVVQFPKPSVSRRRASWLPRLKSIPATATNVVLTVIALIALAALSVVGWFYGVWQNKKLTFGTIANATNDSGPPASERLKSVSRR